MPEKNLGLERLVFFSDAVVAIAITLLALDLKIDIKPSEHLRFADIGHAWPKFAAFFLSFLYVAVFWMIHRRFFNYIIKADNILLWYNFGWLLFVATLPFSTSLISADLFNVPAMFLYGCNTFMLTFFQNQIWDHVAVRQDYLSEHIDKKTIFDYRLSCNVAMVNALIAAGVSFLSPIAAFFVLLVRLQMIAIARKIFKPRLTSE